MAKRPILHPTDFSAASRPAFATALALAKQERSSLVLLYVLNPLLPVMGDDAVSPPTYERLQDAARVWARKELLKLVARARAQRVRTTAVVREGPEAQEIARLARSRRASMIVMGTHGRTGVRRLVLGSVASRMLSLAPCPVLTVRAR